ncbi:MAG: sugar phosphate isomerase/epimerase [Phycisphaerae bacterium]|nr:sugar phosphate isomerase/epimerase [Phycisphaerae bacterium]
MNTRTHGPTRRHLIQSAGAGVVCLAAAAATGKAADPGKKPPVRKTAAPLGLPTYMFKNYDLDQTITMAQRVAVRHICIRSNLLPMNSSPEQIKKCIAKVTGAGLLPYGGGVIYMRTEAQVNEAFEYSRRAGFKVISISILPSLLGLLERMVKKFDIRAAIHNHGPDDKHWPVPEAIYAKVNRLDKRIGICHDTGHTQRAGVDPAKALRKTADRTFDIHLKDVDAATRKGQSVELGRGIVDIPAILRVAGKVGYRDVVGIEYEKHMTDLLPGLAESVGYARGALAAIG